MVPKFSLQNVLDVRHSKVEAIEIELGKLMALQLTAEQHLNQLCAIHDALMEELTANMQGEIDLVAIQLIHANIEQVGELIELAQVKLAEATRRVDEKRRILIKAKQDEEVLTILKQKRVDTFNTEQNMIEARQQDDIYIARAYRNMTQEM